MQWALKIQLARIDVIRAVVVVVVVVAAAAADVGDVVLGGKMYNSRL